MVTRWIRRIARQMLRRGKPTAPAKRPDRPAPAPASDRPTASAERRPSRFVSPPKEGKHPNPPPQAKKREPATLGARAEVPPVPGKVRFQDLDLPTPLLQAVGELGFRYCTPIQAQSLPLSLQGRDVAGRAQTGTGKTAAFLLVILNAFLRKPAREPRETGTPRALILAPTRELAVQIEGDARALSRPIPLVTEAVYGGLSLRSQQKRLAESPVDILVATPGRLLDFSGRRVLHLNRVEILVIDEADRMLDMGFIPEVRRILRLLPPREKRQTLLFSATLDQTVMRLARQWMRDPAIVEIEPEKVTVDTVRQTVYAVAARDKLRLLLRLMEKEKMDRVLIFANRRDETRELTDRLRRKGVDCELLSGEVDQARRLQVLEGFRAGRIRVLVATDVAGRGLHVEGISHVINYNLPYEPEEYVHRIGRTARVGREGAAISFACEDESFVLPEIERFIGREIPVVVPDETLLPSAPGSRSTSR